MGGVGVGSGEAVECGAGVGGVGGALVEAVGVEAGEVLHEVGVVDCAEGTVDACRCSAWAEGKGGRDKRREV